MVILDVVNEELGENEIFSGSKLIFENFSLVKFWLFLLRLDICSLLLVLV